RRNRCFHSSVGKVAAPSWSRAAGFAGWVSRLATSRPVDHSQRGRGVSGRIRWPLDATRVARSGQGIARMGPVKMIREAIRTAVLPAKSGGEGITAARLGARRGGGYPRSRDPPPTASPPHTNDRELVEMRGLEPL